MFTVLAFFTYKSHFMYLIFNRSDSFIHIEEQRMQESINKINRVLIDETKSDDDSISSNLNLDNNCNK